MKNKKLPKEESAMKNLANVCTLWNKSSYTQSFLLLSLMRYFGPQILFCAIWNKGFLDHAHLTDSMQWQKKFEKHMLVHFILWMCSVRVNAALDSQRLKRDL